MRLLFLHSFTSKQFFLTTDEIWRDFVTFKTQLTGSLCLLDSITLYGSIRLRINDIGQKYQPHCVSRLSIKRPIFWIQTSLQLRFLRIRLLGLSMNFWHAFRVTFSLIFISKMLTFLYIPNIHQRFYQKGWFIRAYVLFMIHYFHDVKRCDFSFLEW